MVDPKHIPLADVTNAVPPSQSSPESSTESPSKLSAKGGSICEARENPYIQTKSNKYSAPPIVTHEMNNVSKFRWKVHPLLPNQAYALSFIFHNRRAGGVALLVDRTGAGKSHVMRCCGVVTAGINLIIVPLLALAADVFLKFVNDDETYGTIDAIHFDEDIGGDEQKRLDLISDLKQIPKKTDHTVFIFISPQRLYVHSDLRHTLSILHYRGVFRSIMIDEFHMFCQHGIDFRYQIKEICQKFISPLMTRKKAPYLIACTATCSLDNITTFEKLSGVKFGPERRIWADSESFKRRNIKLCMSITPKYPSVSASTICTFLKTSPEGAFVVYTNSASLAKSVYNETRLALDKESLDVDIMLVHGSQKPLEKFHYTRAFTAASLDQNADVNVRGLVGTSACDTGLDHPNILCLVLCELPRDVQAYLQRIGRGGRQGQEALCKLLFNLNEFLFASVQIKRDIFKRPEGMKQTHDDRKFVSDMKQREFDAIKQLVMLNRGCWHRRIETFCSIGYLPSQNLFDDPCLTHCPFCTRDWHSFFRPIDPSGVVKVFDSDFGRDTFPMRFQRISDVDLAKVFYDDAWAIEMIYDRKRGTIKKFHVEATLMQLFTVGILEIKGVVRDGSGVIDFVRDSFEEYPFSVEKFKTDNNYDGIDTICYSPRKYPLRQYGEVVMEDEQDGSQVDEQL